MYFVSYKKISSSRQINIFYWISIASSGLSDKSGSSPDIGGKPETGTRDETLQARTGKCVLEDGIDYSMLWEAVKAGK